VLLPNLAKVAGITGEYHHNWLVFEIRSYWLSSGLDSNQHPFICTSQVAGITDMHHHTWAMDWYFYFKPSFEPSSGDFQHLCITLPYSLGLAWPGSTGIVWTQNLMVDLMISLMM
jgi:hypothetical protein